MAAKKRKSAAKSSRRPEYAGEPARAAAPARPRDRGEREHRDVGGKRHAVRDYLTATGRSPLDPATLGDLLQIEEGSDPTASES